MWPRFGDRKANCREKSEPDHMIRVECRDHREKKESGKTARERSFKF